MVQDNFRQRQVLSVLRKSKPLTAKQIARKCDMWWHGNQPNSAKAYRILKPMVEKNLIVRTDRVYSLPKRSKKWRNVNAEKS